MRQGNPAIVLVDIDDCVFDSEIYLSWLTGLRLLIEGSVIDPYIFGDRGFWQVLFKFLFNYCLIVTQVV